MYNKICINTNTLFILIFILIIFYYLYVFMDNSITRLDPVTKDSLLQYQHQPSLEHINSHGKIIDPIRTQDNKDNMDPSKFPETRLDRHNLLPVGHRLIGLFSQGYSDTPILRGYLYENKQNGRRILPLYGQETYPNSRRFRYYTLLNDIGIAIHLAPKIEIEYIIRNNKPHKIHEKEIYDGDIVQMNELETSHFIVKLLAKDNLYYPY